MEILYLFILSALSIVLIFFAFITGLHYGSKIKKDDVIEKPVVNPIKIVKNNINEKKIENKINKEQLIEEINLENIDNYNGTNIGQKPFPKEE